MRPGFDQSVYKKHSDVIQRISGSILSARRENTGKENPDSNESGFFWSDYEEK